MTCEFQYQTYLSHPPISPKSKPPVLDDKASMAQQPRTYNSYSQAHMPNGASSGPASNSSAPTGTNFLPSNGRVVQANGVRILCVADVRGQLHIFGFRKSAPCDHSSKFRTGNLRSLNDLAKQARADYIIHTGDFGFYDDSSLDRIADK